MNTFGLLIQAVKLIEFTLRFIQRIIDPSSCILSLHRILFLHNDARGSLTLEKGSTMSFRKNLNLIMLSGLVVLASCGNKDDKKSSATQELNTICEDISCVSSVDWKIMLPGRSFPDKARLDINGTTVLNECVSKQNYFIDRMTEPQSITLDGYYVPKKGELKIDVIDLGSDCSSYSKFISNDKVPFTFIKGVDNSEIHILL